MARKIVITSGKGGVGKTTVAANLCTALARRGERVALCDADFGLNGADVALNMEDKITYDVVDVLEGRCRAKQALSRSPVCPNLYLLSGAHAAPERYISPQSLKLVLDGIAPQFDYIVIDSPSGVDEGFHRAVACADEAVVLATPHLSAIRNADKVVALLKSYRLKSVSLVVNRVRGDLLHKGKIPSPDEIAELLKIPLLGVLGEEENGTDGALWRGKGYKYLAENLAEGTKKIYRPENKTGGRFGGLYRAIVGGDEW